MKQLVKRSLSLLLTAALLLAFLPASGSAQELTEQGQTEISALPETTDTTIAETSGKEVVAFRTENEKHYDMGGGVYQAIAYSHPVHQMDENGKWQDIDVSLSLSQTRSGSLYANKAAGVTFPSVYSQGQPIFSLTGDGSTIAMSLAGDGKASRAASTIVPQVKNPQNSFRTLEEANNAVFSSSIVYADVLPGVDLEYIVDPGTVKENIIVKESADSYRYTFTLNLSGLTPVMQQDGGILLFPTGSDTPEYVILAPYMYDALGNFSEAVTYTLLGNGSTYTLTVTADESWINAKGRSFPVTIDPTCSDVSGYAYDTFIDSDLPDNTRATTSTLWVRSNRIPFIKMLNQSIPTSATINWATLSAFYFYNDNITSGYVNVSAHQVVGGDWSPYSLTWNSVAHIPNFGIKTTAMDTVTTYAGNAKVNSPVQANFNITDTFINWQTKPDSNPNYGIALRYAPGSTNTSVIFKSYDSGYDYRPRIIYSYFVNGGAYFSALQDIYGFTPSEATLIMKLYSQVSNKFTNKSIYEIAWMSSRLLGGLVYGNDTSLSGYMSAFRWQNVAGKVFTGSEESYYKDTLGFTSAEYTQLKSLISSQHRDAPSANEGDFAHMQITLAARLAYYLDIDGLVSNIAGDDETVAYLAGWLGDATLTTNGTTSFGNDDYIADLDAENIYRQILQAKSITLASDHYYSNLSSATRAQIFTGYISYATIKEKVYYELIDKALYAQIGLLQEQGDFATAQLLIELIQNEAYHEDAIANNYPDTHDFLNSIYNMRNTIGDY